MKFMFYNFIFKGLGYFFYSCLLLLLIEKQAVMWVSSESWLLELYFLSACGFIFVCHCVFCWIATLFVVFYLCSSLSKRSTKQCNKRIINERRSIAKIFAQHLYQLL